jgi:hypothetical protein
MRSAQGAYPFCPDDKNLVAFINFIHLHGNKIMRETSGAGSPQIYA